MLYPAELPGRKVGIIACWRLDATQQTGTSSIQLLMPEAEGDAIPFAGRHTPKASMRSENRRLRGAAT